MAQVIEGMIRFDLDEPTLDFARVSDVLADALDLERTPNGAPVGEAQVRVTVERI